jgi:hypothetical protein
MILSVARVPIPIAHEKISGAPRIFNITLEAAKTKNDETI